jgi:chorismate mutase/prephenate dehydratase
VYSHEQVIAQCRIWLEKNLPSVELIEVASTTLAAANARFLKDPKLKGSPRNTAAIASSLAGERYGLKTLAHSIEDSPHNITRFLIIGKQEAEPTGHDKTSIVFSMKDRAGALHDVLTPFKRRKVNLTKIESRPSKEKAWKYYFFVDMQGHIREKKVQGAIKQLRKHCTYLRVLGSYPEST